MKQIIIGFIFLFIGIVNAQEKTAFEKDAYQLVALISKPVFEPIVAQFSTMVAADKKEAFTKEINETLPELYSSLAKIYVQEYTHEEIKQLITFYETPLGQKVAKNSTRLAQKGMGIGQNWGMKVQGILGKYN